MLEYYKNVEKAAKQLAGYGINLIKSVRDNDSFTVVIPDKSTVKKGKIFIENEEAKVLTESVLAKCKIENFKVVYIRSDDAWSTTKKKELKELVTI